MRLAHGWTLEIRSEDELATASGQLVLEAVRRVPAEFAKRVGRVSVRLVDTLEDSELSSRWSRSTDCLEIDLAAADSTAHDCALECLTCLGQVLWEFTTVTERDEWLRVLNAEFLSGVSGEIDEESLRLKRLLLSSKGLARSSRQLSRYAGTAFAGTAAEYVHCLWHDVTLREGPDFLEWHWLRRRLELFDRWFPGRPRLSTRQPSAASNPDPPV
jgi:hypothetical protein